MGVSRILSNICADDLSATRDFYIDLLGLEVTYDSAWYVLLRSPTHPTLELGIIARDHELVPAGYRHAPTGMYLTFVVDDVDATHEKAIASEMDLIQGPVDEFYGQRRFLVRDPAGTLVDVSSPWKKKD